MITTDIFNYIKLGQFQSQPNHIFYHLKCARKLWPITYTSPDALASGQEEGKHVELNTESIVWENRVIERVELTNTSSSDNGCSRADRKYDHFQTPLSSSE